jgi:pSer/pThr/pTyr-binding forkhead associated (FHA) protein
MADSMYLVWVDAEGVAEERQLLPGSTVMGRASACDLVLLDSGVSREHARIDVDGNGATIHDLKSRNGTWVNGEQTNGARLEAGDEIGIGRRLRLCDKSRNMSDSSSVMISVLLRGRRLRRPP